jgi:hypothetical protein
MVTAEWHVWVCLVPCCPVHDVMHTRGLHGWQPVMSAYTSGYWVSCPDQRDARDDTVLADAVEVSEESGST